MGYTVIQRQTFGRFDSYWADNKSGLPLIGPELPRQHLTRTSETPRGIGAGATASSAIKTDPDSPHCKPSSRPSMGRRSSQGSSPQSRTARCPSVAPDVTPPTREGSLLPTVPLHLPRSLEPHPHAIESTRALALLRTWTSWAARQSRRAEVGT